MNANLMPTREDVIASPKRLARIAGLLYLAVAVLAAFAFGYVLTRVYIPGNSAATAANVAANAGLVRLGVVADLAQATIMVFLAMTLHRLLRHVNRNAAGAMVILVAIATTIMCLNLVFEYAALLVATNSAYVAAFGAQGAAALVLLLLDLHHHGFLIAQIFFGLWLVPLGYLAFRSGMFPKALGVVLILAGVCYLVDVLAMFLAPGLGARIHTFVAVIPATVAELWMVLYLLVVGVRTRTQGTVPVGTTAAVAVAQTSE
jgi:hypothetical protein